MTTPNDIALITPIECNKKSVDSFGNEHLRYFEDEAIRCIKSWRNNGGWLKDIQVYGLNATNAPIQDKTISSLKKLGVNYIDDFKKETLNFSSSFLNEPFCGKYFESINPCKESILIKIDLDMQLLKPIPKKLIEIAHKQIVIGQYDAEAAKDQRGIIFKKSKFQLPFDTNFIITSKQHQFYQKYFDACYFGDFLNTQQWKELETSYGSYYIEEFAIDWLASKPEFENILYPITHYQYGEGYPSLALYSDDEIQSILFLHEHIYKNNKFPNGYNAVEEHLRYLKRSRRIHD